MAVTTKKTFPATTNATTTVFSPVSIHLHNQDDLDVYVTLSGGTRVLQNRNTLTNETAQASHKQVNDTTGLYFPAVSVGTALYNYQLSTDNNTITFNSALPQGAVVFCERRTRDADSSYTTFASGSTIRAKDLNDSAKESNFTAQDARNKALEIENAIFNGAQPTINGVPQPYISSTQIIDGAIATADIADNAINTAKIADDSVTMAKLSSGTLPSDIAVNGANITDLSVATGDIANDAVTSDKLANTSVSAGTYTAADITVDAQGRLTSAATGTISTSEIAADAITGAKIADDAVDSEHIAADSLDTEHYAPTSIDSAALASNAVITSKITDANVTTTKIADSNVTLAKLANDLKQTTISDSDTQLPTSGAVVDYVAAQLEPFGGFEAIANEVSFPNTQPASGVAISIADAAGIVVSGSGSSTTGRTVGGSTVTINGIPSNFHSSTIATGIRFIVTSTGSGQVYNYHKATLPESDLVSLSGDINDFNERYRVGSSNPTSNNDAGDLFFNTGTGKMMVFNGTSSAFEEVQSIGNFFLSTLSPAFNGSLQNFTLSNAPANVQQVILSINGVVQKPNAGTSTPSEGFALDGSTIKLASAPASGSDYFAVVMGSTVNIGTPSNNTVTTAILQDNAVATAKIQDDAVTADKLANSINTEIAANTAKTTNATHTGDVTGATALTIASGAVTTAKIADDAVTADKLADTSVSAGSYGSATAIPAITVDAQGRITAASTNSINTSTIPVADESTDTTCFPVFVTTATGDQAPKTGSNLTFNSATGALGATSYTGDGSNLTGVASAVADGCIYENSQTISNDYTISTNKNALSAGPITIANGVTLTIPSGSTYVIV
jgi:hypothetical protein